MQAKSEEEVLRQALAELVAVKDLKRRVEALEFGGLLTVERQAEYDAGRKDYLRRQPAAWDAARAALAMQASAPAPLNYPEIPDGWLPIETAPKNGKSVLLLDETAREPVLVGHMSRYPRDQWVAQGGFRMKPSHWRPVPLASSGIAPAAATPEVELSDEQAQDMAASAYEEAIAFGLSRDSFERLARAVLAASRGTKP